jgi:TolB-like protein
LIQALRCLVGVAPRKEAPSIAVLPFTSMSADVDNEYFGDGVAEEIINALTQLEGLHVAARTSSFSFKGKPVEIGEIARCLNVRHLLQGSVRRAAGRVRVLAQLVDASNGFQIWSERFDRDLADVFDVQDEIARAIVRRLKVDFAIEDAARLVKVTTTNMEAYQAYLQGRAMLYRRGPWIARALESFKTAVELDKRRLYFDLGHRAVAFLHAIGLAGALGSGPEIRNHRDRRLCHAGDCRPWRPSATSADRRKSVGCAAGSVRLKTANVVAGKAGSRHYECSLSDA